jgi:hypothetical protein
MLMKVSRILSVLPRSYACANASAATLLYLTVPGRNQLPNVLIFLSHAVISSEPRFALRA